jgi:hypothetical protein
MRHTQRRQDARWIPAFHASPIPSHHDCVTVQAVTGAAPACVDTKTYLQVVTSVSSARPGHWSTCGSVSSVGPRCGLTCRSWRTASHATRRCPGGAIRRTECHCPSECADPAWYGF